MDKPESLEPLDIVEPLVFNDALDCSAIQNVLLIDSSVTQSQLFYDSANENTFPILYSNSSKKEELLAVLNNKFSNGFSRLAIVFHDPGYNNAKPFLDNSYLFVDSDLENTSYSENTAFLIELLQSKNVKNVDFLACNTLSYPKWKQFYELIQNNTQCIVGASNDKTGNLQQGADWVMESTGQNVETMYFTNEIQEYSSTLAATSITSAGDIQIRQTTTTSSLEYSTDDSITWNPIPNADYPIYITNSNTDSTVINVKFTTNITFSSTIGNTNAYFEPLTDFITFDGQNNTVTISSITDYLGLIKNGTSSSSTSSPSKRNITVKNIKTTSNSSTLHSSGGGWVCQSYFGAYSSNIQINNCSNSGSINGGLAGGICGAYAGSYGSITVTNCSNTGSIGSGASTGAGGICGVSAGYYGTCTVSDCSNTGSIITNAGGICGARAGSNGQCTVSNCSNTGSITGDYAGGICGARAGSNGTCTISDCSNTGLISGYYAGGICGYYAGYYGTCAVSNCSNIGLISGQYTGGICGIAAGWMGNCTVTNCSNTGSIGSYSGGICGASAGEYGTCNVTKCFNTGLISGIAAGGICGFQFGKTTNTNNCSITNCYNIGTISGTNTGGIVGAEVGKDTSKIITISQCYNLGSIGSTCGGICGGKDTSFMGRPYTTTPIVNISNCYNAGTYTTNGTNYFIADSLQIKNSIVLTNTYYANGIASWSDSNAQTALLNTPTNVWTTRASDTPYVLSAFNSDIYNPSVVNTLATNTSSSAGVFTSGYTYSIVSILVTQGSNQATSYTGTGITIDSSTGAITFSDNISSYTSKYQVNVLVYKTLSTDLYYAYNYNSFTVNSVSCFNYGTKILCLNQYLEEEYIPVQNLKRGTLVKTYLHGYRRIDCLGKNRMLNEPTHKTNCMFKMEKTDSNGLIEDLIVTGGHGIMVNELTDAQSNSQLALGFEQKIDHKKLLLVCNSDDFKPMKNNDVYTYYHFTLENDGDDSMRYGVWANGLLMETPNKEGFNTIPFERI
jgi:hypothetical protein